MDNEQNLTSSVSTRCSTELRESLEKLAERDRRPLGNYVRFVLEKHVEDSKKTGDVQQVEAA